MKHAAAVRMVARGCACACLLADGRAVSGGVQQGIPEELLKLEIEGGTMKELMILEGRSKGGGLICFLLCSPNRGLFLSSRTS